MIRVNEEMFDIKHFPDGTLKLNFAIPKTARINIQWDYENEIELVAIIYLTKHIKSQISKIQELNLVMRYIPNARFDRTKDNDEIFTLKYFADIINSLQFDKVIVTDPHSHVSEALLNNLWIQRPEIYIQETINRIKSLEENKLTFFYPDKGAFNRYHDLIQAEEIAYGEKIRDWKTGSILGLNIVGEVTKNSPVLIIDDICSRGGTFFHSSRKLKDLGVGNIYLYVTHCENTVLDGELINSGLVKKIYTTKSIFTKEHKLIEIVG